MYIYIIYIYIYIIYYIYILYIYIYLNMMSWYDVKGMMIRKAEVKKCEHFILEG